MAHGRTESSDSPKFPAKPKRNWFALACSLLACMTSVLLGYDIGVMTGAIIYIQRELKITNVQKEILMGIFSLYSLVGCIVGGRTSDWIGRRSTIVVAGAIFFVGALLMGLATSYAFLMVGRFVAGIGVGYALTIAPVYTAELAPASCRGFLLSFPDIFINIGILLGYVSNLAFSKLPTNLGWRLMLGVGAVPAAFLTVVVFFMPESPRWLVMQGRLGEAKAVLHRVSDSPEEAEHRLADIKSAAGIPQNCTDDVVSVPNKRHTGEGVWRELLLRPTAAVRHVLLCALGMHFFVMACGIEAVVLYSPEIFRQAGIRSETRILLATMGVGVVKVIFIVVASFFVDRIGRRKMLLTSVGGCTAFLAIIAFGLTTIERSGPVKWAVSLCVASILCYVGFFSLGMGPVTWVYTSEIFPLRLRAQGVGLAVATSRTTSAVFSMTFISLYQAITLGGSFFMYAGLSVLSWVFFYTLFPETRGRALEEIEGLFGNFLNWRSSEMVSRQVMDDLGEKASS